MNGRKNAVGDFSGDMLDSNYLTAEQAAKVLNVNLQTLYAYDSRKGVRDKKLPAKIAPGPARAGKRNHPDHRKRFFLPRSVTRRPPFPRIERRFRIGLAD
jgi:hypothetical protein